MGCLHLHRWRQQRLPAGWRSDSDTEPDAFAEPDAEPDPDTKPDASADPNAFAEPDPGSSDSHSDVGARNGHTQPDSNSGRPASDRWWSGQRKH